MTIVYENTKATWNHCNRLRTETTAFILKTNMRRSHSFIPLDLINICPFWGANKRISLLRGKGSFRIKSKKYDAHFIVISTKTTISC